MYTDEHGFKTLDAPPDWPFGRLTPEQMAQRPANPVPASLQGRQRDKDTTAVIYGGIDMYTDEKTQQLIEALNKLIKLHHDWDKGSAYVSVSFYEKNKAAIAEARATIAKAEGR